MNFGRIKKEAEEHAARSLYRFHEMEWLRPRSEGGGSIEHLQYMIDYEVEHMDDDIKDDLEDYEDIFEEDYE